LRVARREAGLRGRVFISSFQDLCLPANHHPAKTRPIGVVAVDDYARRACRSARKSRLEQRAARHPCPPSQGVQPAARRQTPYLLEPASVSSWHRGPTRWTFLTRFSIRSAPPGSGRLQHT
jgi:hypothetical protein